MASDTLVFMFIFIFMAKILMVNQLNYAVLQCNKRISLKKKKNFPLIFTHSLGVKSSRSLLKRSDRRKTTSVLFHG